MAQADVKPMIAASQASVERMAGQVSVERPALQLAAAENFDALAPSAGQGGAVSQNNMLPLPMPTLAAPPAPTRELPSVAAAPTGELTPDTPLLEELSSQSKAIADALPPQKRKHGAAKEPITIAHAKAGALDNEEVRQHKSIGISISVRRPKMDVNHMLEEAYDALIAGNQEEAIEMYKQVLAGSPRNRLALFGLATTYHRAGQLTLARPLYGRLLAIDPNNEEGLNNFLVLLADESPLEALEEMKKLQRTHADFSPLPAQMAVVYEKIGDYDQAVTSMKHAIELSPENIKYRYDMAVILDRRGNWEEAAAYYQQLLTAYDRGEKIPAKAEEIQERLTFIRSNRPNG
jgi:tetratricopeptide (TPR) repeat protein